MRVLITADTLGGVWTYAVELVRALSMHKVEVVLATMGRPLRSEQREDVGGIPGLVLSESEYRLAWMPDPWHDVRLAGSWLLALERRYRPDVIHLNDYAHGSLPWDAPVLLVGHSCVLSWWEAVHGTAAPPCWGRYHAAVTRGIRAARVVVAPSRAMLEALERHYGPLQRGMVILNGREPALFQPRRKEPVVITVGRLWDEAKNAAALGQVAGALPWPVVVAGDASHPDGRHADIPNVRSLGRMGASDLAHWLGRASIFALPARYEPFGLSALEAGLAGCALVLGDIPSLREIWEDAALFVDPHDPGALQASMERLIADAGLRRIMAARARAQALRYTPQRMLDGYLRAYGELTAGARTASEEAVPCAS